jgi:CheY-like chemotaxis protein
VGVRSVLGQGSTFHLVLPMAPGLAITTGDEDDPAAVADSSAVGAGHVLVIGDHVGGAERISEALSHGGNRVDIAADAFQALRQARAHEYDGLVVDLTREERDGLGALAQMRSASETMAPTVLAITLVDKEAGTGGFAVEDVLTKPLQSSEVIQAMTRLGIVRRGASVVVIDDDPVALDLMRAALGDLGIQALCFDRGAAALEAMREARPSAIVLDLIMPEMDGFAVLERLRQDVGMHDTPVFVWSALVLTDSEYDLIAISASAILRKGGGELESMLERLRRWRSVERRSSAEPR